MIGLTHDELERLGACRGRAEAVTKLLGGAKKWNGKKVSVAEAIAAGVTFDDLVWVASAVARTDEDVERRLRLWLADVVARVLPIYEKQVPDDNRVRDAIVVSRRFARGEATAASGAAPLSRPPLASPRPLLCSLSYSEDSVWNAAWHASQPASGAAAWYAARAAAWGATLDVAWRDARAAERKWQFERLVLWLSDEEPEDVVL